MLDGVVDVTVTTALGTSAIGANDRFTYVAGGSAPTATTTAAIPIFLHMFRNPFPLND